jgi:VanZ family protein
MLTSLYRNLARNRWQYAIAASAILFYLSSLSIRQPGTWPYLDKVEHITAYTLLSLAYFNVISRAGSRMGWRIALGTWLAVVAYGISDECHQYFVPGRTADVADVLADAVGGAVGIIIASAMRAGFVRRVQGRLPGDDFGGSAATK